VYICPSCGDDRDETVCDLVKLQIADCKTIEDEEAIVDLPDPDRKILSNKQPKITHLSSDLS
jgi:hypothetical protein